MTEKQVKVLQKYYELIEKDAKEIISMREGVGVAISYLNSKNPNDKNNDYNKYYDMWKDLTSNINNLFLYQKSNPKHTETSVVIGNIMVYLYRIIKTSCACSLANDYALTSKIDNIYNATKDLVQKIIEDES